MITAHERRTWSTGGRTNTLNDKSDRCVCLCDWPVLLQGLDHWEEVFAVLAGETLSLFKDRGAAAQVPTLKQNHTQRWQQADPNTVWERRRRVVINSEYLKLQAMDDVTLQRGSQFSGRQ